MDPIRKKKRKRVWVKVGWSIYSYTPNPTQSNTGSINAITKKKGKVIETSVSRYKHTLIEISVFE